MHSWTRPQWRRGLSADEVSLAIHAGSLAYASGDRGDDVAALKIRNIGPTGGADAS
jgi:hypothetical protein